MDVTKTDSIIGPKIQARLDAHDAHNDHNAHARGRQYFFPLRLTEGGLLYSDGSSTCAHEVSKGLAVSQRTSPEDLPSIDRSCVVMKHFNLYYYRPLGLLACETCATFVPAGELRRHLLKPRHGSGLRQGLTKAQLHTVDFSAFSAHLILAFNLPKGQMTADLTCDLLKLQDFQLEHTLPGFPRPRVCLQCDGCAGWYSMSWTERNKKDPLNCIRIHERHSDTPSCRAARKRSFTDYRSALAVQVFQDGRYAAIRLPLSPSFRHATREQEDYALLQKSQAHPLHAYHLPSSLQEDLSLPSFFIALGWSQYLKETAISSNLEVLLDLVRAPGECTFAGVPLTKRERSIERGLREVYRFLWVYLDAADKAAGKMNLVFRRALVSGW